MDFEKAPEQTASSMIQAMKQKATSACMEEINQALIRHKCGLVGVPQMVQDGAGGWKITTRIDIVSTE